jgi:hypothetical protein
MEIQTLSELQVEAVSAAASTGLLCQIQPNLELDKPEVYEVWIGRVEQTIKLVTLGLLKEIPVEGNETINMLRTQYPGRDFKLFEPTTEGQAMFGPGSGSRGIN